MNENSSSNSSSGGNIITDKEVIQERLKVFREKWNREIISLKKAKDEIRLQKEREEIYIRIEILLPVVFLSYPTMKPILDYLHERRTMKKSWIIMLKRTCKFFYENPMIIHYTESSRFKDWIPVPIPKEPLSCSSSIIQEKNDIVIVNRVKKGYECVINELLLVLIGVFSCIAFVWFISTLPDVKPR